jgi:hypothetical protein
VEGETGKGGVVSDNSVYAIWVALVCGMIAVAVMVWSLSSYVRTAQIECTKARGNWSLWSASCSFDKKTEGK